MLKYHLQNIFSKPDFIKINSELKWYKEIGHDQIPYKFPYNWLNFESLGARDEAQKYWLWGRPGDGTPEPHRQTPSQLGGRSPTGKAGLINALKCPNYEQVEIQGDKGKHKYSEF